MPEIHGELALGRLLVDSRYAVDIDDGSQPGPVGAGIAMDEYRLRHIAQPRDEFVGALDRQFPVRGHGEVDECDAQFLGRVSFFLVPGLAGMRAAQIHHRPDAEPCRLPPQYFGGWLRRAVKLPGDDFVEVSGVPQHGLEGENDQRAAPRQ